MLDPTFFDVFGLGTFGFITAAAAWALKTHRPLPRWVAWLLLTIGILGLIADGAIVYMTYLR